MAAFFLLKSLKIKTPLRAAPGGSVPKGTV